MSDEDEDTQEDKQGFEIELGVKQMVILSAAVSLLAGFSAGTAFGASIAPEPAADTKDSEEETPKDVFRQISNDLELDTERVMQCYENSSNDEAIQDRDNAVRNLGGLGTPSFFVGNREKGFIKISGAQTLPRFEEAIGRIQNGSVENATSLEGIELEGEPSKGSPNAPVKVVEYNEFGCPFCAEWNGFDASSRVPIDRLQIADSLESQYVESGEVQLISKDYPAPRLHPNGPMAHKAANCVYRHEEDSYWEFHDRIFENRDRWMRG